MSIDRVAQGRHSARGATTGLNLIIKPFQTLQQVLFSPPHLSWPTIVLFFLPGHYLGIVVKWKCLALGKRWICWGDVHAISAHNLPGGSCCWHHRAHCLWLACLTFLMITLFAFVGPFWAGALVTQKPVNQNVSKGHKMPGYTPLDGNFLSCLQHHAKAKMVLILNSILSGEVATTRGRPCQLWILLPTTKLNIQTDIIPLFECYMSSESTRTWACTSSQLRRKKVRAGLSNPTQQTIHVTPLAKKAWPKGQVRSPRCMWQ